MALRVPGTYEENEWVFDIETLGFDGGTYPLICIGMKKIGEDSTHIFSLPEVSSLAQFGLEAEETAVINQFKDFIEKEKPNKLIGYNLVNFDLPFLKRRCFKYKMPSFRNFMVVDVMTLLERTFGMKYPRRLSDWCKEAGYVRPSQYYGEDIPILYLEGKMNEIKLHNEDDLKVTEFIYLRCKEVGLI